jgi:large subunit ribosomal protein L6
MSKIGRKPIELGLVQVKINGNEISYSGKKESGIFHLTEDFQVYIKENKLFLLPKEKDIKKISLRTKERWGLQRALLFNKIKGAETGFEKQLRIVGLGFKAVATGNKVQFSLGYSHKGGYKNKSDFILPEGVVIEIDKTGQLLTLRSSNKERLGAVCAEIKALRPPEPYKGTGIQYVVGENLIRKAGKTAKTA